MQKKLANLLSVKSIVTLLLTITFVILSLYGVILPEDVVSIFLMVITFYFTKQDSKEEKSNGLEKDTTN